MTLMTETVKKDETLDLAAYFERIGYSGSTEPTLETLTALHRAHVVSIPYENLDIFMGKPIEIQPDVVFKKLVTAKRGGYCFEMNGLFSRVLEALGFEIVRLRARVWFMRSYPDEITFPSHQIMLIKLDGKSYIADVGFGGMGPIEPLHLEHNAEQWNVDMTFRLTEDAAFGTMLEGKKPGEGAWLKMYTFDRTPCFPVDYEPANFYLCRSPESFFTQNRVCARPALNGRASLHQKLFKSSRNEQIEREVSVEDYQALLAEYFDITLNREAVTQILGGL